MIVLFLWCFHLLLFTAQLMYNGFPQLVENIQIQIQNVSKECSTSNIVKFMESIECRSTKGNEALKTMKKSNKSKYKIKWQKNVYNICVAMRKQYSWFFYFLPILWNYTDQQWNIDVGWIFFNGFNFLFVLLESPDFWAIYNRMRIMDDKENLRKKNKSWSWFRFWPTSFRRISSFRKNEHRLKIRTMCKMENEGQRMNNKMVSVDEIENYLLCYQ